MSVDTVESQPGEQAIRRRVGSSVNLTSCILLARVSMPAREMVSVSCGRIVMMGVSIPPKVCLRVGSIDYAWGELVDIEGEIGVRILSVLGKKDSSVSGAG